MFHMKFSAVNQGAQKVSHATHIGGENEQMDARVGRGGMKQ